MTKQFVICKNDSPVYSLPLETKEESAQALLTEIKREQGEESSNGTVIYWRLREVELLEIKPTNVLNIYSVSYTDPTNAYPDTPIEMIVSAYSEQQALELALQEEGWGVLIPETQELDLADRRLEDLLQVTQLDINEPQVFCHVRR